MSAHDHQFTLGIEEEFQIIDPETRELRSHVEKILEDGKVLLKENVKAEMHQSVIELGTDICHDAAHARQQVVDLRSNLASLAGKRGLKIASAGTHPFFPLARPGDHRGRALRDHRQRPAAGRARQPHLRVACARRHPRPGQRDSRDEPGTRYFLPHLFALSTNSPFWLGRDTGFKGYRLKVFENFPRTGIPDAFESISEYEDYLKLLVKTNCIDNAKKIWWDIRLHPFFNTLEVRVCDAQSRVDDTMALAALIQAIVCRLYKFQRHNLSFRLYRRRLLDENRWRACRYGLDGKLIDFGSEQEVDERSLIHELLDFIKHEVEELGIRREVDHVETILREGSGADRQLAVWERTRDPKAVVDHIIAETHEGLTLSA